jgi:gluconokinase
VQLRSPRESLGGYVLFPRLIDKVRLLAKKQLPREYVANVLKPGNTIDGRFLTYTGVDAEPLRQAILSSQTDEEVLAWIQTHAKLATA